MPASPSGLPGATISPCSRWTRRTTAMSRPGSTPVDVGQRVLAGLGVEQMRAGQVAEPVAQRDQPAHRSDVARREGDPGIGASRSCDAARSRTRSCEPIATIVRSISATPRSSATSTSVAGVMALDAGGHDEQPVGAHERGEHARRRAAAARRRARRRRGPSRTRTQSSMPIGEASLRASRARAAARASAARPPRARPAAARRRCRRSATPRPG